MNSNRSGETPQGWDIVLKSRLSLFGHRNWIVVADSAYPAQSNLGIETIVADVGHLEVLRTVVREIAACRHIRPIVYTDRELHFVQEEDAPGMTDFRKELESMLSEARSLNHEEIIAKLDQSASLFRALVIKTNLTIPYTSVFFELDCGYWNGQAESRLRNAMCSAVPEDVAQAVNPGKL